MRIIIVVTWLFLVNRSMLMPIIVSIYFNIKLTNPTVTQCKIELSGMIMCATGNRAVRRGTGE